jgi:hypothetical protein
LESLLTDFEKVSELYQINLAGDISGRTAAGITPICVGFSRASSLSPDKTGKFFNSLFDTGVE